MTRTLRELQLELRELIARPSDDPAALAAAVGRLGIRGDARLSAVDRVRIYAEMYLVRLRDALAHDFVALNRALGDHAFAALARRYVAEHPSDRSSLRDLGRHLPAFAARHPELLPAGWLAELARLEWALVEAFDAPDQEPLRAADLEQLAADAWPELRLEPVASLVLLDCDTPVDALRERILAEDGVAPSGAAREAVRLRVWRQDETVFQRRMAPLEAAALRRIGAGTSFASLCAWLGEDGRSADPARAALGLLELWLADELLAA